MPRFSIPLGLEIRATGQAERPAPAEEPGFLVAESPVPRTSTHGRGAVAAAPLPPAKVGAGAEQRVPTELTRQEEALEICPVPMEETAPPTASIRAQPEAEEEVGVLPRGPGDTVVPASEDSWPSHSGPVELTVASPRQRHRSLVSRGPDE